MVQGFDVGVERGVVGEGTITGPTGEATRRRKERRRRRETVGVVRGLMEEEDG